jgi:hypothetical protein
VARRRSRAASRRLPRSARQGASGLIDGGVDAGTRCFQNVRLQRFGCGGAIVPKRTGTAVAAILATARARGEIFAADVYCGAPPGGAVDAVAAALGLDGARDTSA